ncbi:MAG: restriction endonuclease subunit S [Planctomycetota bacterium]
MGDWQATSLLDEIDLLTGFPFKSDEYTEDPSGIKLVRGDNVVQGRLRWDGVKLWPRTGLEACERYLLDDGDVVLAMDRPWIEAGLKYARLTTHDLPALLVQRVARLRGGDSLDQRFLYYLIGSRAFTDHVLAVQTGTAVPHISGKQIQSFDFILPPLDEQRAIASVLGSLDDKIELNRRMNRTLEQMTVAIVKAWFVDFEPVRAKASGAASFPGMPQPVFDALPATFADSELGPIPEGWEVRTVSDFARLSKSSVKPQEHAEEVFDHFSIPAFDSGQTPSADSGESIKSNKFAVVGGCILVSKLNPRIPRVWLSPVQTGRRQIASTEFLVIVPNDESARAYLWCQFRQPVFADDMAQRASGTSGSHQRVKPGDFMSMAVVQPSSDVVEAFATLVVPKLRLIEGNRSESQTLAETRDALLPKLLSGKFPISQSECSGVA